MTNVEFGAFLKEHKLSVTDVVRGTGLTSNTIYKFLGKDDGKRRRTSTQVSLENFRDRVLASKGIDPNQKAAG
jgi:hypothetical protein